MKHEEAIEFSIPFGAYKNWRLSSYPYPDWAEIFNLKHMILFAIPIALSYPPGVILNYSYTSGVLERVSNLPTTSQELYITAFKKIIQYFKQIVPPNLKLALVDIRKYYNSKQLESELIDNFNSNIKNWQSKYCDEIRIKKLESAKNNLVINGIEDLSTLTSQELEKRHIESAMWCDALDSLELRRGFNKYGHRIQLVYIRGPNHSLHIGSCRTANIQFVMGSGVIEKRHNSFIETIMSANQIKKLDNENKIKRYNINGLVPFKLTSLENIFVKE